LIQINQTFNIRKNYNNFRKFNMFQNHSLLKKITEIIFGNTLVNTPKQKLLRKRVIGFETLENRDYLSVGPLLYDLPSFQNNVSAYFDNNSHNESNETVIGYSNTELTNNSNDNIYGEFFEDSNVTANLMNTEWHDIAAVSMESDEECDFGGGTVSASSETSETDERFSGVVVDISRTDEVPFHAASVTVEFALTGTATPGVDYSVSGLTYNDENDRYEGEITIPYYVTSTTYTIGILNDAITESSETVIFTLISVSANYEIDSGSVTVTINDDDDWTVTGSGDDSIWERAPVDDLPFGEFEITRSGGPDRTYGITTEFVLSGNATPGVDYHLSWFNANDYETVISVNQDNGVWKGSVYFPANTTDDTITIYVIPNNDALPESNETVTITVTTAYANSSYPFTADGSGTVTIKDDDKWKISVATSDGTATERISDVAQDYGEFKFVKTFSGEGEGDQSYGITAVFDMIYDSGDVMSAKYSNDYSLQCQNTSGQWVSLTLSNAFAIGTPPIYHYQFSVTIPAGQTEMKVRLIPTFDWEDEAELFNPFGGGTPKDDDGELADFELVSASWSGMGDNWNPLGDNTEGQIEIKDGAFVSVTSDFNNDGTINKTDYDNRHGDVGSLVLLAAQDYAAYYVWVEVLGSHVYDLNFTGAGGIAYVSNYNEEDGNNYDTGTPETLYEGHNLATGTVEVVGANNSANISSGCLSLAVGSHTDWTRFSVFSVTVDMAFNHDRSVNNGSDGLNIRTNANDNTEHDAPEFRQNAPGTGETWLTPNGSNNQKTVLYLKDKSVTVYNRFVMSLVIPYAVTLNLKATAVPATITTADGTMVTTTNASIGGCEETTVTFTNGISTGGKSVSGVAGFIEFAALSNTSNKINKEQSKFNWNVTKIIGKTDGTGLALETDTITFYTIFDVPQSPWNVSDTTIPDPNDPSKTIPQDDKLQPWVTALEFAIGTAAVKGNTSPESALSQLTTFLHAQDNPATTDVIEGHGMTYEPTGGNPKYFSGNPANASFNVTGYISKGNGNEVNCYDQTAAVTIFGRLLGISAQFAFANPFGYINTTTLVGNIETNNPCETPQLFDTSSASMYPLIEDTSGNIRNFFRNHAYAILDDFVYDACAGAITGIQLYDYYNIVIDFTANHQFNLKNGINFFKEDAGDITHIILNNFTIS
jgi:hypothetical protein